MGLLQCDDAGRIVRLPPAPVARLVSRLLDGIFTSGPSRYAIPPDEKDLRSLIFRCWERTDLLGDREATRFAHALLALSAHWRDWLRPFDEWEPPECEPGAQFGSLARHLLARYDVPAFLNAAWFAGLTPESVRQQGWFKHVGRGGPIAPYAPRRVGDQLSAAHLKRCLTALPSVSSSMSAALPIRSPRGGPQNMWTCPRCGERVDPGHPSCWSCGTFRGGTADPILARADKSPSGEWHCPKCAESVDAGFEVCWSCGTSREGVEDPTFERADEAEVAADIAPYEPHPEDFTSSPVPEPIECLRCRGRMEEGFVADYRDRISYHPIRWFPGRPEPSLWTGTWSGGEPIAVRTYRCVRCGRLESFAAPEE